MRKSGPTSFSVSFSKPRNYSHFWKLDILFRFITWNWEMRGRGKEGDVRKSGPTSFPVSFSKPRNYSHFHELDNLFDFITRNWEMGGRGREGNVRKVPESFIFSEIKNFLPFSFSSSGKWKISVHFHFHPEGNGKLGSIFIFILR